MAPANKPPALVASSAPKELQISELNAAADLLGNDALDLDFHEAVNYIMTHADAGNHLSEEQQQQLYGLFRAATATKEAPTKFDSERYEHEEQWKAHLAVGSVSKAQAKHLYCDLVATAIPDYLLRGDDEASSDTETNVTQDPTPAADAKDDLYAMITDGNLADVQQFLTQHSDAINTRDSRGLTPLMVACDRDQHDIVRHLVNVNGIDINAVDEDHQTALHYAVIIGSFQVAQTLVEANADVAVKDLDGADVLSIAKEDSLDAFVTLIEATLESLPSEKS